MSSHTSGRAYPSIFTNKCPANPSVGSVVAPTIRDPACIDSGTGCSRGGGGGHRFGSFVFDDAAMEQHLPAGAYHAMRERVLTGALLDPGLAESVAYGMKEWAIEKGATCFTHWFHPLNEKTARKYDSFITPKHHVGYACEGYHITQFTGKQLLQGEPDGSSFPSGGLRKTSAARGYTAWDCTSPAFVITDELGGCLYIPAVFCSIFGLSMDSKTPLLKSERAVSSAVLRVLKLIRTAMGDTNGNGMPKDIYCTIGLEQEMFIVDRELYLRRPDLVACGKTVLGRLGPKGQQLSDHYWGQVPQRVLNALKIVQEKMWSLGYPVTTVHNEVAPAQFEMAPIFERASVASDHNMLLMQILEKECEKHGLALLLHEKPFAHVNGSGKHTNWSLATDSGENLLAPGSNPRHNAQFLFLLSAFLRAVHAHSDVLRAYISVPGNEFRLGGMEAPPAIISVFIGQQLEKIINDIVKGTPEATTGSDSPHSPSILDLGLSTLPRLHQDKSDRNRTSPLAFTGNRFEFRAVGSSQNCAGPITAINAIFADALLQMAVEMENMIASGMDKMASLQQVICTTLKSSLPIVYNGDCYDQEYVEDMAKKRGIPNISSPVDAMCLWNSEKNKNMFSALCIMSPAEVEARGHVWIENYSKVRAIEANCTLDMAQTMVLPCALGYQKMLCDCVSASQKVLCYTSIEPSMNGASKNVPVKQLELCHLINGSIESLCTAISALRSELCIAESTADSVARANVFYKNVGQAMTVVRAQCDNLEGIVAHDLWPLPSYSDFFSTM